MPLYKFLAKFPEVGDSIIDRFENSVKDIPPSTSPKYSFQVFQLVIGDIMPIAVENDDSKICRCNASGREIEAANNILTVDTIKETTGHWAEDKNTAAASVKLSTSAKPSDISTRFVVSKEMESGKNGNVSIHFHTSMSSIVT